MQRPADMENAGASILRRRWVPYAVYVLLLIPLALTSLVNYLLFHSLAEAFGVGASFTIAAVVLNSRGTIENNYLRILGVSYLFTAVIEILHLLAYQGMGIFPSDADLATQLWLALRYIQAATLVVAPLAIGRRLSWGTMVGGYAVVTSALLAAIFLDLFPVAFDPSTGLTPFKIVSEYVIIVIAAIGGALLYWRRSSFDRPIHLLLMGAVVMFILAELAFTLYLSVFSFVNMLGHLFLLTEFFLVFMAIVHTGIAEPSRLLYRELQARETLFRGLVEGARDVMFQYQLVPRPRFTYISPVVQELTGYSQEEFYRDPVMLSRIVSPAHLPALERVLALEEGNTIQTLQARRRDGKVIWLQISAGTVRDPQGRPVGREGIGRDVTEAVQAFEQLNLAQHKLQLLGSLTRHDLRNHISTAAGYMDLAHRSKDEARKAELLVKARASLMDMNELLESTKKYYELGRVPPTWLPLSEVVRRAMVSLDLGGLRMEVDLPPVEIYADEMLVQVFHNLVHNTLRHGGGATFLRVRAGREGDDLSIVLEDDGPGIPEEDKEAIFEWNYRSRRGHGLHYVREVLATTGLSIRESGTEGQGARFEISVPPGGYRPHPVGEAAGASRGRNEGPA